MTQFWKNEAGTYYYQNTDGSYSYLPTGSEGERLMAKIDTAKAIVSKVQTLVPIMETASDLVAEYWDVTNAVGAFTDEDLAPIGITAVQLTACLTLVEQMPKLFEGLNETDGHSSIFPTTYRITVNSVKRLAL